MIFKRIVNERKRIDQRRDDCLHFVMDQGDNVMNIILFVQGVLFAGQLNLGISAAYVITYPVRYSEWQQNCREELVTIADRYVSDPSAPLLTQL